MTRKDETRVLVIDDDPAICDLIVEVIQELGVCAQSVVEKAEILRNVALDWDCVIVDLTMPDLDGIEVLRILSQNGCDAPIILISGFSTSMLNSARKLGEIRGLNIVDALTKPIDIGVLEAAVSAALETQTLQAASTNDRCDFNFDWTDADVDHGGVIPYYQPKIDVRTGELAGFEALARWWHPQKGLLPPSAFIPQAIAQGRIDEITMAMVERIAVDIRVWSERGDRPLVAMNVEADSLADLELPGRIGAALSEHDIDPDNLILEVTESGVFENLAERWTICCAFGSRGMRFRSTISAPVIRRYRSCTTCLSTNSRSTRASSTASAGRPSPKRLSPRPSTSRTGSAWKSSPRASRTRNRSISSVPRAAISCRGTTLPNP